MVQGIHVPLLPLKEQHAIVEQLDNVLRETNVLEGLCRRKVTALVLRHV
jgi:restriction endonuclease S subunit